MLGQGSRNKEADGLRTSASLHSNIKPEMHGLGNQSSYFCDTIYPLCDLELVIQL